MKIYRVENAEGEGPHRWKKTEENSLDWHELGQQILLAYDGKHYPTPDKAFTVMPGQEYVYGCNNKADLNYWFRELRPWLEEFGFHMVEYEVNDSDVLIGKRQVAFIRP